MIFLEIAMILIGLGAIVFSNKMIDTGQPEQHVSSGAEEKRLKEQWAQLEKRFQVYDRKLEEKKEEQVEDTSARMSELSNEKIMGINEYSDQVIDKIEKNHAEVVFLYDMLNGKQEEIQGLIQDADTTKAEFQDEMAKSYQDTKEMAARLREDLQEEVEQIRSLESKLLNSREKIQEMISSVNQDEIEQTGNLLFEEKKEEPPEIPEIQTRRESKSERPQDNPTEDKLKKADEKQRKMGINRNEEILSLYHKGHSVLEISKMLVLGQGEVKFVIDMYGE